MNSRPIFILGIITVTLLVILDGVMTAPHETWEAILRDDADLSDQPTTYGPDAEKKRRQQMDSALDAQWELAEFYLQRGDYDRAEKEYYKIKTDFPYTLQNGIRHDDAGHRLREIARIKEERTRAGKYVPPGAVDNEF